jgi:hypothetical protein
MVGGFKMFYRKLSVIIIISALIVLSASITTFAANPEVVESTEEMSVEGLIQKEYDTFADFREEVTNGSLIKELKSGNFPVKLTNKVYTLQTKGVVSKLKFDYKDSQTSKKKKETLKLENIVCTPDHVTFDYDNDVYFTYYPDYKSNSIHNTVCMYDDAKKDAIKSKVINKHRVYVTYNTESKRFATTYIYTWVEDDCLFMVSIPKERDINYGFALCQLKKSNTFKQK